MRVDFVRDAPPVGVGSSRLGVTGSLTESGCVGVDGARRVGGGAARRKWGALRSWEAVLVEGVAERPVERIGVG